MSRRRSRAEIESIVDQNLLLEFFLYNRETGKLYWRERDARHFPNEAVCGTWNTKNAGKEAGYVREGYRICEILTRPFKVHRIIWCIEKGAWPGQHIDHIDGDKLNNRIENLRDVSQLQNSKNASISSWNTSGRVGVSKAHRTDHWGDCWQAYINANGKRISLGLFKSFEDACAARSDAEKQYGYHENHGRLAA